MTLRVLIAAEIAWIMYRFEMLPVESLYGVLAVIAVGSVVDFVTWRANK